MSFLEGKSLVASSMPWKNAMLIMSMLLLLQLLVGKNLLGSTTSSCMRPFINKEDAS